MRTYVSSVPVRSERFPYLPNRPEWSTLLPLFAEAAKVNPAASTFVGARTESDGVHFRFQEWGNPEVVVVVV